MLSRRNAQTTSERALVERGLVIDQPWAGLIVDGKKTWEMRTRRTNVRGWIGVIQKGTGTVIGLAYLKECLPPLSRRDYHLQYRKHRVPADPDRKTYAGKYLVPWVMSKAFRFSKPVQYKHASGAVTWVRFTDGVASELRRQLVLRYPAERI